MKNHSDLINCTDPFKVGFVIPTGREENVVKELRLKTMKAPTQCHALKTNHSLLLIFFVGFSSA